METGTKEIQIIQIIEQTNDAKTFVLEPMHNWQPFYKAGQFITFVFQTKFGEKRRSYSLSSSPLLNEQLSITVKKVDNGEFSRWFLYRAAVGDVLQTNGINGFFCLPEEVEPFEQIFFLAAGSGISPCFALIKTLLNTTPIKVVLIYSNKSEHDTIFLKQLLALHHQYADKFELRLLNSNNGDIYNRRLGKWLLSILLQEYLKADKSKTCFYLCGPFDYMLMISITLLGEGIQASQIRKEIFNPYVKTKRPKPSDTEIHLLTIRMDTHKYVLPVQYPQTILAAAKLNNIPIPYSCESGSCGACAATCTNGKTWMAYNEVLMDSEINKGRVLTCQAYVIDGDAEIVL